VSGPLFYTRLLLYLANMVAFGYLGFGVLDMNLWLVIAVLAIQGATIAALIWFRFRRRR
jgi:hypothetical protein